MIRRATTVGLVAMGLIAASALAAAPAHAQSLTGTWTITSEGRGGPVSRTLVLTQEGSSLTGTITLPAFGRGGGGGGGTPQSVGISEGSVNGNAFSFTVRIEFQGNAITQQFSGTFDADSMQGQTAGGRGGSQPFSGTRGG